MEHTLPELVETRAARSGALAPKWRFLEVDGAFIFPFGAGRQIHDIWRFLAQFDIKSKKAHFYLKNSDFFASNGVIWLHQLKGTHQLTLVCIIHQDFWINFKKNPFFSKQIEG